ncbi:uncharacterized protein LOC135484623 [Lineus longissimus]|uniref:uncharacterized protein LOC135484623 n=1 Tax=Lineus longissimus TaxID=88925 RepID=UPI00315D2E65
MKSQFCQARCLARCKDLGFLRDCPHKCEVFTGDKWLQECGKSAECVSTCNHLTNATGIVPAAPTAPRVHPSGVHNVDISWSADDADQSNSSLIFVIEFSSGAGSTWSILAKTWQQHYEASNLDVCQRYHYRIAAVNRFGQSGYSPVVSRTDAMLPRPGPIHSPTYITGPYYDAMNRNVGQVGYFKAVITWKSPIGWNDTTEISKYSQPTSSKICNSTNHNSVIGIPLPLVNYQSGSKNVLEVKVLSKAFGCRFEFKVHAVTRCGTKGQEGSFILDLSDCKSIDNYHPCPTPMGSIDPDPVRGVMPVPINNTLDVEISWTPPVNLGTSRFLLEYRLQWGLVSPIIFLPALKSVENETVVPANTTKTVITVNHGGREYGVRIIAIGSDSKPVKWGLLAIKTFMVPEPIFQVRKDEEDEPVKSTTKLPATPTQPRFLVTLNTTEHLSPYISDTDVAVPGELKETEPHPKSEGKSLFPVSRPLSWCSVVGEQNGQLI